MRQVETSGWPIWMPDAASASVTDLLSEARERTDGLLNGWAERVEDEVGGREGQALAYALRTPGKRVRAALLLAAYRAIGGESPAIGGVGGGGGNGNNPSLG